MNKNKKIALTIAVVVLTFVVLSVAVFFVYTAVYYHTDEEKAGDILSRVEASRGDGKGYFYYEGEEKKAGVILYPGGKVEYTAYAPLAAFIAQKGYLCVVVEVPFNLAVLKPNAADGIKEKFPEIESWYIGGHSLGGSIAAKYLSSHDDYDGLILLGSYSTDDLSKRDIKTLSVYGSNDKVLNRKNYDKNLSKLPNLVEKVVEGGCHAYFGVYGFQKGDGEASVSNEEQIKLTADFVDEFLRG